MPNTLVHIAIQTVATKAITRSAGSLQYALLGCVIPDLPWILQRILAFGDFLAFDPYTLRAYVTVQATLFMSMIAAAAAASLSRAPRFAFALTSFGCLLHLLLDGSEIKWGNGVHLFAPFEWHYANWGIVWPNHVLTKVFTLAGPIILGFLAWRRRHDALDLVLDRRRTAISLLFLVAYFVIPASLIGQPFQADNHYLSTLSIVDDRLEKHIELDRIKVIEKGDKWYAETFAKELIELNGLTLGNNGIYSIKGRFVEQSRLEVEDWHHHEDNRDLASIAGLALLLIWFISGWIRRI